MQSTGLAVTVSNYTAATNNRFTNDPSFVGNGFDWSGVGRSSSGRWATLIGDNYFISANHARPGVGETISFIAGNSATDPTFTYTVAGGFQVSGTDLWIGYTNEVADSSLSRYAYSTTPADTLADVGLPNMDLYVSGDQVSGSAGSVTDHVVGTNQAESFRNTGTTSMATPQWTVNFASSAGFDQLVMFANQTGDNTLNITAHEAQLQGGDSGSPLFAGSGGILTLQGIAYAVSAGSNALPGNFVDTAGPANSPQDPLENRDASYFTYVGSYESQIASTIAQIPSPVPEPSSVAMLVVGLLATVWKRTL